MTTTIPLQTRLVRLHTELLNTTNKILKLRTSGVHNRIELALYHVRARHLLRIIYDVENYLTVLRIIDTSACPSASCVDALGN